MTMVSVTPLPPATGTATATPSIKIYTAVTSRLITGRGTRAAATIPSWRTLHLTLHRFLVTSTWCGAGVLVGFKLIDGIRTIHEGRKFRPTPGLVRRLNDVSMRPTSYLSSSEQ